MSIDSKKFESLKVIRDLRVARGLSASSKPNAKADSKEDQK